MSFHDQDTAVTDVNTPPPSSRTWSDCLVVIYHPDKPQQGKRRDLIEGPVRIGRQNDNDVVVEDEGASRRHARIERRGEDWIVMDVGSTNGTLINNNELVGMRALRNGDRLKIGSVILKYLSGADIERDFHEEIYTLTITDNLTQLCNRRHFDDELAREFSRARRHTRPLSVVAMDIDFFKGVNDTYGHLAGDAVLQDIARVVRSRVRRQDVVARHGGEEFSVLMPETKLMDAAGVAEELRTRIADHTVLFREQSITVTVSAGCAELTLEDTRPSDLIHRCDQKLYSAKRGGRNRVVS